MSVVCSYCRPFVIISALLVGCAAYITPYFRLHAGLRDFPSYFLTDSVAKLAISKTTVRYAIDALKCSEKYAGLCMIKFGVAVFTVTIGGAFRAMSRAKISRQNGDNALKRSYMFAEDDLALWRQLSFSTRRRANAV